MEKIVHTVNMCWDGFCGEEVQTNVYVKITYKDGKLSLTGVEGPFQSGNCRGSCGQIDPIPLIKENKAHWIWLKTLNEIWERWHLNDLNAGSPAQEEYIRQLQFRGWKYDYDEACDALLEAGLYRDPEHSNYRYGTDWLFEEVPKHVITFLESLPTSKFKPAWV